MVGSKQDKVNRLAKGRLKTSVQVECSEVVYVVSGSCQGESELEREMTRHTPQRPRDLPSLSVFQTAFRRTRGVYRMILFRCCHNQ
jgi:hypothetical protein